jgi:DNA-binding response OmpR family regulator
VTNATERRSRARKPARSPRRVRGGTKRVLFVDDDEGCRLLVSDVLGGSGLEVSAAATVDSGLRLAAEEEFDLVILDLMLPSGTGGEAAFKIRELDPKVPIMALSGYLDKWDHDDLRALGFTDWMAKPFKTAALIERAEKLITARRRGGRRRSK